MAHRFLVSQDTPVLYITLVAKDRLPVFRTDEMKDTLCRAIDEARKSAGFLLFAYVIMIDHMHLLTSRPSTTSEVLRVAKGFHQNPVRAGLLARATDYLWSSARIWQGCPLENEPLSVDKDLVYWRRSSVR